MGSFTYSTAGTSGPDTIPAGATSVHATVIGGSSGGKAAQIDADYIGTLPLSFDSIVGGTRGASVGGTPDGGTGGAQGTGSGVGDGGGGSSYLVAHGGAKLAASLLAGAGGGVHSAGVSTIANAPNTVDSPAYPFVRPGAGGFSTSINGGSASSPGVVAVPTSAAVGDLLVLQVTTWNNIAVTTPSGWTKQTVSTTVSSGGTYTANCYVFTKVAVSGDLGTNLSVSFASADYFAMIMLAVAGANATTPVDSQAVGVSTTNVTAGSTITFPSDTVVNDHALVLTLVGCVATSGGGTDQPTMPGTTIATAAAGGSVGWAGAGASYRTQQAKGASGTFAGTKQKAGSWVAVTLAIAPAVLTNAAGNGATGAIGQFGGGGGGGGWRGGAGGASGQAATGGTSMADSSQWTNVTWSQPASTGVVGSVTVTWTDPPNVLIGTGPGPSSTAGGGTLTGSTDALAGSGPPSPATGGTGTLSAGGSVTIAGTGPGPSSSSGAGTLAGSGSVAVAGSGPASSATAGGGVLTGSADALAGSGPTSPATGGGGSLSASGTVSLIGAGPTSAATGGSGALDPSTDALAGTGPASPAQGGGGTLSADTVGLVGTGPASPAQGGTGTLSPSGSATLTGSGPATPATGGSGELDGAAGTLSGTGPGPSSTAGDGTLIHAGALFGTGPYSPALGGDGAFSGEGVVPVIGTGPYTPTQGGGGILVPATVPLVGTGPSSPAQPGGSILVGHDDSLVGTGPSSSAQGGSGVLTGAPAILVGSGPYEPAIAGGGRLLPPGRPSQWSAGPAQVRWIAGPATVRWDAENATLRWTADPARSEP